LLLWKKKLAKRKKADVAKVLVTGGAGFIGSHLVERLVAEGHAVTVLDNYSSAPIKNTTGDAVNLVNARKLSRIKKHRLKVECCDVSWPDMSPGFFNGVDYVFHLAGRVGVAESIKDARRNQRHGETATLNVLEYARLAKVKRFIFASSASVYGDCSLETRCVQETQPVAPVSPYAVSKAAGEMYLRAFSRCHNMDCVSLRFFNVFGARQRANSPYSGVIARFLENMRRGEPLTIYGDGRQTRDFVPVDNVVDACMLAMATQQAVAGEAINVGCGAPVSLLQVVQELEKALGKKSKIEWKDERVGDIKHSCANIAKAEALLGYKPRLTFAEGLEKLVEAGA
jgi:UDP-glucose 4-epimerase